MTDSYGFAPIGVVRSPFVERAAAPRQPPVSQGVPATIELLPGRGYEFALSGLDAWEYVWIVFVFHRNVEDARGWKPKVQPPRSTLKRGVFATRSPHRPNPIGLSAVQIDRVDGCIVHVRNIDLLDGTPVLDVKPYVAYADAHPGARAGWLESNDPIQAWEVEFTASAQVQMDWLKGRGVDLQASVESVLRLGPEPHPYRRIRRHGSGMRLAIKDWRADFDVVARRIIVGAIASGHRARDRECEVALVVHRDFCSQFDRASRSASPGERNLLR